MSDNFPFQGDHEINNQKKQGRKYLYFCVLFIRKSSYPFRISINYHSSLLIFWCLIPRNFGIYIWKPFQCKVTFYDDYVIPALLCCKTIPIPSSFWRWKNRFPTRSPVSLERYEKVLLSPESTLSIKMLASLLSACIL